MPAPPPPPPAGSATGAAVNPLPVPASLSPVQGPEVPGAPEEPVLDVHEIQGNVLVGFNKDHQTFLFFRITDPGPTKQWLKAVAPQIASTAEVLSFRRLFRALRARRGAEASGMTATWIN